MRLTIIVLSMALPHCLSAEIAPVVATEHENFTRMVITTPPQTDWLSEQNGSLLTLELPENLVFDLKETVDQVTDLRISSISSDRLPNVLEIQLACECKGTVFSYEDVYLVIDIGYGTSAVVGDTSYQPYAAFESWWRSSEFAPVTHGPTDRNLPPTLEGSLTKNIFSPDRLARDISSSTAAGTTELRAVAEQNSAARSEQVTKPISDFNLNIGMRSHTNVDTGERPNSEALQCNEFRSIELFSTTSTEIDYGRIAKEREHTFNSNGEPAADQILPLAISYQKLGFGNEAVQILELLDEPAEEIAVLSAISRLIASPSSELEFWDLLSGCDNSLSFWVFMQATNPNSGNANAASILTHFKSLPAPLQKVLAGQTHRQLLRHGWLDAANELNAFMKVISEDLESTTTDAERRPALRELQLTNRDEPELITQALSSPRRAPSNVHLIAASEAVRFEYQNTPNWAALLSAEISTSLALGDFSGALDKLRELTAENMSASDIDREANAVFSAITTDASDTDFLASYFVSQEWPLSPTTAAALEKRFIGFGISELDRDLNNFTALGSLPDVASTDGATEATHTRDGSASPMSSDQLNSANIRSLLEDTKTLKETILGQMPARNKRYLKPFR